MDRVGSSEPILVEPVLPARRIIVQPKAGGRRGGKIDMMRQRKVSDFHLSAASRQRGEEVVTCYRTTNIVDERLGDRQRKHILPFGRGGDPLHPARDTIPFVPKRVLLTVAVRRR